MADTGVRFADGQRFVHFVISLEQCVDGPVADRMSGELQSTLHRGADHGNEALVGYESHTAVFGIANGVDLTEPPRFAHVSAPGEHPAIEKCFDANYAKRI